MHKGMAQPLLYISFERKVENLRLQHSELKAYRQMKTNVCLRLVPQALIRFYFTNRPSGSSDILNGFNSYLHRLVIRPSVSAYGYNTTIRK
jgi:hypothetical protein